MVNRGPSNGCITCKRRRIKCDGNRPSCQKCNRVGRQCAGYGKKPIRIRFKNETDRKPSDRKASLSKGATKGSEEGVMELPRTSPAIVQTLGQISGDPLDSDLREVARQLNTVVQTDAVPPSLQPQQQDLAVSFFLTYITQVGRSLHSSRGFLELIRPVLAKESCTSVLSATVTAAALRLWHRLRPGDVLAIRTLQAHQQALGLLQTAVHDYTVRTTDATILATLVLQLHDTFTAMCDCHTAQGAHRDGALALLAQSGSEVSSSAGHRDSLLSHVFHSKVSFSIRQRIPFSGNNIEWLLRQAMCTPTLSPGLLLDVIGVSVANLQCAFDQFDQFSSPATDYASSESNALSDRVLCIDAMLQNWLEGLPPLWPPKQLHSGTDFDASVATYDGTCVVFPGIQIASIWNQWLIYCLIVAQIQRLLACRSSSIDRITDDNEVVLQAHRIRWLVDSICHSIPFYLGNMTQSLDYRDIVNAQIRLPGYHCLQPTDVSFLEYQASDYYASPNDHARHIMLQGPLHAMSALSHLISLFAVESTSITSTVLPHEQTQWIQHQYLRSLRLIGMTSDTARDGIHSARRISSLQTENGTEHAKAMARSVGQKLWTMNIL